jgi:hypothetical protein
MLRGAPGSGIVPVTKSLNRISKIAEQMPTIGDLDGARSTLTNAVGIGASTIAGDDLNAGPIAQPRGDSCSLAIGQEINHFVRLEVDQHRAIATTASPRPIIDAEDTRHRHDLSGTAD